MKIAIIGAGNMGGAIARGLAKGSIIPTDALWVANPSAMPKPRQRLSLSSWP